MALDREQVATLRCLAEDIAAVLDTPETAHYLGKQGRDDLTSALASVSIALLLSGHRPTGDAA